MHVSCWYLDQFYSTGGISEQVLNSESHFLKYNQPVNSINQAPNSPQLYNCSTTRIQNPHTHNPQGNTNRKYNYTFSPRLNHPRRRLDISPHLYSFNVTSETYNFFIWSIENISITSWISTVGLGRSGELPLTWIFPVRSPCQRYQVGVSSSTAYGLLVHCSASCKNCDRLQSTIYFEGFVESVYISGVLRDTNNLVWLVTLEGTLLLLSHLPPSPPSPPYHYPKYQYPRCWPSPRDEDLTTCAKFPIF